MVVATQEYTEQRREQRERDLKQRDDEFNLAGQSEHVPFTGVRYVALVDPRSIRFTRAGDMVVGFTIPARYVDSVIQLRAAMRVPVILDIQPYRPNAVERANGAER
jgi:hypothetical protein